MLQLLPILTSLFLAGSARAAAGPGLTADDIRNTFKPRWAEVDKCYADNLPKHPEMAGILRVRFDISEEGTVLKSFVEKSELNDPPTEKCVTDFVKSVKFPPPGKGGIIRTSYPFSFTKPKVKTKKAKVPVIKNPDVEEPAATAPAVPEPPAMEPMTEPPATELPAAEPKATEPTAPSSN